MSDMTMREAVLWEFTFDAGVHRLCRVDDMADEIRGLRDENAALRAAVERVRALHTIEHLKRARWCRRCKEAVYPCSTLRALEGTP